MGFRGAFLNDTFLTCTTACIVFSAANLKSGTSKAVFATFLNGALVVKVFDVFKRELSSKNSLYDPNVTAPLIKDAVKIVPIFFMYVYNVGLFNIKIKICLNNKKTV